MTRSRHASLLAFGLVAVACVGGCGGMEGKRSQPLPCASGALLHLDLSPNVVTMTQPTITVCRNDACFAWAPAALPTSGSGGTIEAIPGPAAVSILGTFWRSASGAVTLDVEWDFSDASELMDGDHYVITLANGSAAPTTLLDKTAIYKRATSTGLDSGAVCLQAKLSA